MYGVFQFSFLVDIPVMAMIVIITRYLMSKKINSTVKGLTEEFMNLATSLGLDLVAESENKVYEKKYGKRGEA